MEPSAPRPPLGIFKSNCDDKGRVRLPKEFQEYVKSFPEQEFFATTLDGDIGRIYPIDVWRENQKILEQESEDPQAAEDQAFFMNYLGSQSGLDANGRVLLSPQLRRKLGIENQAVNLEFYNGAINIYSEAVSEKRLQRAMERMAVSLPALRKRGLR